jgi:Ca-activated chloride channel homolog
MKYLIAISILTTFWIEFNQIREANKIKTEAQAAFNNKNYKKAIDQYNQLIYSFKLKDENLRLNLAHSYYKTDQKIKASYYYKTLTSSADIIMRSVAFHQLGVIYGNTGKTETALFYFKETIKLNPENEKARYNYELIKKIIDQQNKLSIGQKNRRKKEETKTDGAKKTGPLTEQENEINILNQESKEKITEGDQGEKKNIRDLDSPQEKKELQPDKKGNKNKDALRTKRLAEINISEEKARAILESMKNSEIQYLQQKRHREYNREYKNKPDW